MHFLNRGLGVFYFLFFSLGFYNAWGGIASFVVLALSANPAEKMKEIKEQTPDSRFYKLFWIAVGLWLVSVLFFFDTSIHFYVLVVPLILGILSIFKDKGDIVLDRATSQHLIDHVKRTLFILIASALVLVILINLVPFIVKPYMVLFATVNVSMFLYPIYVHLKWTFKA